MVALHIINKRTIHMNLGRRQQPSEDLGPVGHAVADYKYSRRKDDGESEVFMPLEEAFFLHY